MHSLPVSDNPQPLQSPAQPPSLHLPSLENQPLELGEPVDMWANPVTAQLNKFVHKSLSNFACNLLVGCSHGCSVCSVPLTSTRKLKKQLAGHGVQDADAEWGNYVFVRPWDEHEFLASLAKAEAIPIAELNPDGNRAVIFCSTTDAYQVIRHPNLARQKELNNALRFSTRRSQELIRDRSTLPVRILTRSPLARRDFDLFKSLDQRLMFGMSLPTVNNDLARLYEPGPAPTQRLATLKAAKEFGLHIYVAIAPAYPECDAADMRRTIEAIKPLDPITIFFEPVNIRAQNVTRMVSYAQSIGRTIQAEVFATPLTWRRYAIDSLRMFQGIAEEMGILDRVHLWPDSDLGSRARFLELRWQEDFNPGLTHYQQEQLRKYHEEEFEKHYTWLQGWWNRISEWPGQPRNRRLVAA